MHEHQDVIDAIQYYHDEPMAYAEEVEGVSLDEWQIEALENLVRYHFLAIRSGSGVGKTFLLGLATRWFLFTRPRAKVPTTAPSQHQLYDVLWAEHFKRISDSPILNNLFVWTQTRLGVKGHEPEWYAVARTAQVKPGSEVAEGLQGFHDEENLLFIIDEASGVPDAIFPAMEGSLTGRGAYCILAGNPTRTHGYFYDTFNNPALRKLYHQMHVSCYDSPRVSKRYIEMMEERYGANHPIFLIKVKGEFSTGDSSFLIPPSFLDAMENNVAPNVEGLPVEFGVDVGRARASSVLCARQGTCVLKYDERHKRGQVTDTREIVQWVIEYINEFEPTSVKVDAIGIGAGVYDGLHDIYGDMIIPVVGSMSPEADVKERYLNLRAQGYWELREKVPFLYCKEWPNRLITELGDIRTKPTSNLKIKIESKEDMLARAMKSPDYADATYMAFLSPDACRGVRAIVYEFPVVIAKKTKDMKKKSRWSSNKFTPHAGGRRRFDVT